MNRRNFIKTSTIALAATSVSAEASENSGLSEEQLRAFAPTSLEAEFSMQNGNLVQNPNQRVAFSRCFGCFNTCGVRVRIDKKTDEILRVCGSPYCANTQDKPMDMNVSLKEAFTRLAGDAGLENRTTVCGRGNGVIDAAKDKHRVTNCLKRVGKRGENRWKTISYEDLIKEVTEGGDLFGEGEVEGLKSLRDLETPANEKYSDFGPKANQLLGSYLSEQYARTWFYKRFMEKIWGTVNLGCKDSYCGHQQSAGCGLGCFDAVGYTALPIIDYDECEYAILIGTSPGLSGNSLNANARRIANAKKRDNFKYLMVDPILRSNANMPSRDKGEWLPIRSGGDTAFMFGLLQYVINNELYFKDYLTSPSVKAAGKKGQLDCTNATYLVVKDKSHPLYNKFLTADILGIGKKEEKVCVDEKSGKLVPSSWEDSAKLFYDGEVTSKDGKTIKVASSFSLLKARVNEHTMEEYAAYSGVAKSKIAEIAKEFSSRAPKVGIETSTGCSTSDGSLFAWAGIILLSLMGAHNAKGGVIHMNGVSYADMYGIYNEPLYDFDAFEKVEPEGFLAERSGVYEKSNEYKEKVASGKNPYPANEAWTATIVQENSGEQLIAHANKNPFQFKAWITWSTNPIYSCSGLATKKVLDSIKDPKQLPLIIGIDPYINETNQYADYIVPDTVQYEEYACTRMWGSELTSSIVCMPAVEPKTAKNKEGNHICMEQFFIDLTKALKLKGLGKNAFKDKKGKSYDINVPSDYYIRLFANVAHTGSVLPAPTKEDLALSSVDLAMPTLKKMLKPEEVAPTAFLLSRGGRYEGVKQRYDGNFLTEAMRMPTQFQIYNEAITDFIDSYSGKRYDGQPSFKPDMFWGGKYMKDVWNEKEFPFKLSTLKPQLRSPYSAVLPRIGQLTPTNFIMMNAGDAKNMGLKTGDKVKLTSPLNATAEGILEASEGISKGSIAVPNGYGHTAFGAKDTTIDGKVIKGEKEKGGGVAINPFIINDPTRKGASLYRDQIFGSTSRHGFFVKIEKV